MLMKVMSLFMYPISVRNSKQLELMSASLEKKMVIINW